MKNSSKYSSILLIESGAFPINDIYYFDALGNKKNIKDSISRILNIEGEEVVLLKKGQEIPIKSI